MNEKELASKVVVEVKEIRDEIEEQSKAKKWYEVVYTAIPFVVEAVEGFALNYKTDLKGADKKKLAVNLLNQAIDIPYVPEWAEAKLFNFGIELVIKFFNKKFGKKWLEKLN